MARIAEDLRGVVTGDVLCDDASRALYATDGSLFEVLPLAIVRPQGVEDVAATVARAARSPHSPSPTLRARVHHRRPRTPH